MNMLWQTFFSKIKYKFCANIIFVCIRLSLVFSNNFCRYVGISEYCVSCTGHTYFLARLQAVLFRFSSCIHLRSTKSISRCARHLPLVFLAEEIRMENEKSSCIYGGFSKLHLRLARRHNKAILVLVSAS